MGSSVSPTSKSWQMCGWFERRRRALRAEPRAPVRDRAANSSPRILIATIRSRRVSRRFVDLTCRPRQAAPGFHGPRCAPAVSPMGWDVAGNYVTRLRNRRNRLHPAVSAHPGSRPRTISIDQGRGTACVSVHPRRLRLRREQRALQVVQPDPRVRWPAGRRAAIDLRRRQLHPRH